MEALSAKIGLKDNFAAQEHFHSHGWTDGLPVVPPTPEAVADLLNWAGTSANQLIGIEPVRGRQIIAEKLAINSVMAGCLPMHFPAVIAAWQAMLQEEFLLHGATSSTGGCAVMIVLNGPVCREIGAQSRFNALGGGSRATSVIGRAVRLGLINVLQASPGALDRSTLGHPGKISFCIAEDESATPWLSLAEMRGIPPLVPAVTVMAAAPPRQIMNEWTTDPEEILETYAAEMRANMLNYSIWSGNYAIVIPCQHREQLQKAGWSKSRIAAFLYQRAKVCRGDWAAVGKQAVVRDQAATEYRALASPEHLLVIAAGGPAGGFGSIIPPWLGLKSQAVTQPIGACVDC